LVFDTVYNSKDNSRLKIDNPVMIERVSEIFTKLMIQLFVFGSDINKSLFYHIVAYSKSPVSIGIDDTATIVRFTEFMIRLFMAIDLIPKNIEPPYMNNKLYKVKKLDVDHALMRFKRIIKNFGPLFTEYDLLWNNEKYGESVKKYCWDQFRTIYSETIEYIPEIWNKVSSIYDNYICKWVYCSKSKEDIINLGDNLRNQVDIALKEGRPLVRTLFTNNSCRKSKLSDDFELFSLTLICNFLRQYIPDPIKENIMSKKIHLQRDYKHRKVMYDIGRWHEFQIDKGAAALFCPVPLARKERLKKQIIMLKTFWDISSFQRYKRLKEIINDNWKSRMK